MRFHLRFKLGWVLGTALGLIALTAPELHAQKGGRGGAKPSMGRVGGAGARPSVSRPSAAARPNVSRPNMSRPSMPNMQRPSLGNAGQRPNMQRPNVQRPNVTRPATGKPSLPSMGGSRPSLGGAGAKPNLNRPTTRPSTPSGNTRPSLPSTSRPAVRPPSAKPSITRPSVDRPNAGGLTRPSDGGNRPTTLPGNTNRPGVNRPSLGNTKPAPLPGNRPGLGGVNRPTTLPGNIDRPGNGNRPGLGGTDRPTTLPGTVNRPGLGNDRPTTLPGNVNRPGNRPGFGNNQRPLPGGTNRPGNNNNNNRPIIGGNRPNVGNTNINRPNIGNNTKIGNNTNINNRPNFGNNTNINIGQIGNDYINRPNWDIDPGFSRPSWGLNDDWHHHWHDNCIHNHHNWYNGCWNGYWGSNWYAPLAWGAVGWGLGTWTSSWNTAYYNPYYAMPSVAQAIPYDYSQPVVINNNVTSTGGEGGDSQASTNSNEQAGLTAFDEGLAAFKGGDYVKALSNLNSALKLLPNDPVVHEVRCLALFAVGDYNSAAAGLNSLLAAAPGMDWTTMSGLYGNVDDYTAQLRKLEGFATSKPNDPSSHFVLAYHYLVTGAQEEAVAALRVVVANQPKDVTARRMLDSLAPAASTANQEAPAPQPATPAASDATTDLVGNWKAAAGDSQIELSITEDSQFTWKVTGKGQAPVQLSGNLTGDANGIELITSDQGTMGGTVTSKGPDAWVLAIAGAPKSDPGLSFTRVK